MDLGLDGKRALITGSTRGLGAVMARTLAAEGAKVVIHGRNAVAAHAVAGSIGNSDQVAIVLGDLADATALEQVAAQAQAAFGGVDILINNAGIFGPSDWDHTYASDWVSLYAANVAAPAQLSAMLTLQMKDQKWGRLIHIGSLAGSIGLPMCPNYAATKAALAAVSSSLAKKFGKFGITSNIVGVGTIANMAENIGLPGSGDAIGDPSYNFMTTIPDGHYHINPIGRSGTAAEVAYMVTVLASPLSSFVNGAHIRVDGGCVPNLGL
jgi:3-oxoacyl-[acyl-carrier protein] reductase